jgi:moderate conductance mechanosensitive channel
VLGVDAFADSAVVIRMVINTKPARQWNITRELRRRIKNRFDSENIEIPFPHLTVYWGEPNVGKQQGLDVRKVEEIRKSGTGSGKKSAKK